MNIFLPAALRLTKKRTVISYDEKGSRDHGVIQYVERSWTTLDFRWGRVERARGRIPRLDDGGVEGGGCTTKDGEKRSLFYSGGARPAIWSYKINHSSSPAVGATRQINRSSLLMSLLATSILPPTSIVLPVVLSLSLSIQHFPNLSSPSLVSHSWNKSFAGTLTRYRARWSEREKIERTKDRGKWHAYNASVYICCTVLTLLEDVCIEKMPVRVSIFA